MRYARAMSEHRESEHPSRGLQAGSYNDEADSQRLPTVALSRVVNDLVGAQPVLHWSPPRHILSAQGTHAVGFANPPAGV